MQQRVSLALAAAITAGIAVRVVLLVLPPSFVTDVYYYDAQAVGYLARGIDPYGATYAVPAALATAGATDVFAYLPGVFTFIGPASVWNPRLGLVLGDVIVAACLFLLGRSSRGTYSALYLLLPPTILFSTWFMNNSLPSVAFLSVAILLEARGRPGAASPLWGMAMAASQEAWFVFPFYAYRSLRARRFAEVLIALAVFAAVTAPFYLWNPSAFVYDTIVFQFTRQPISLLSTGPFGTTVNLSLQGILVFFGTSAPLAVRGAIAAVALVLSLRRQGRSLASLLLVSTIFASLALFLLAGELFWSYLELPLLTLLAWGAVRKSEQEIPPQQALNP